MAMTGDRYIVRIPAWGGRATRHYDCTLVAILEAMDPPTRSDVARYYGTDAPKGAFQAQPHDRLVFEDVTDKGRYIVVPDVPRNRENFWLYED